MAVFTPLEKHDIQEFLSKYNVGELANFEGILQGVDNTNYRIETTSGKYILTIFESRIDPNDLPFFLNFMSYLKANGIVCPSPISSSLPEFVLTNSKSIQKMDSPRIDNVNSGNDGRFIICVHSKPAALFSFLDGQGVTQDDITPALCHELGILLGHMHIAGQSFPETRKNSMSFDAWETHFHKIGHVANPYMEILRHLKAKWPQDLPRGAIHLDFFPDNVFIKDNHIYGVIDFYFSATDFLAYDFAIVLNAWCFDGNIFNQDKWQMLLSGYQSIRQLTAEEKENFQILCQGAALRFLSSRLHDYLFHDPKNLVTPKSPDEYIEKLEFHKHAKLF